MSRAARGAQGARGPGRLAPARLARALLVPALLAAAPAAPRAAAATPAPRPTTAPALGRTPPNGGASGGAELRARGPDGAWRAWWRAGRAPARWGAADARLAALVAWREAAPGVEVAELPLSGAGEAWRVRAVLVRLDPARHRLALDARVDADGRVRPWAADRAPAAATLALNAGMFGDAGPWGWVVHAGREVQPPGAGALASALVVGRDGRVRVLEADSLAAARAEHARGEVAEAVQGYPTLLAGDGVVPAALRPGAAASIDLAHRDARLAVGELRDGRLLVALTRFDAFGAVRGDLFGAVPLGLTVPEAAALMGALGARRAVLLDGGLSAQLAVGAAGAGRRVWGGLRRVPLGLVAVPR